MLTKFHEEKYSSNNAWKMSDAPKDYMEMMLDGIVAFRVQNRKYCRKEQAQSESGERGFRFCKE